MVPGGYEASLRAAPGHNGRTGQRVSPKAGRVIGQKAAAWRADSFLPLGMRRNVNSVSRKLAELDREEAVLQLRGSLLRGTVQLSVHTTVHASYEHSPSGDYCRSEHFSNIPANPGYWL